MSQTPNTAIAVIGIDIGKNSFHVVGHDARRVVLTARPSLPVHPDKRTISEPVGMSQTCHDQTSSASFDHLVGAGEHCSWDGEAKRLGRLEIDDEIEFGGLFDWDVGRLRP